MSRRKFKLAQRLLMGGLLAVVVVSLVTSVSWGGNNNGNYRQAVGGVSISPEGVLAQPSAVATKAVREDYLKTLSKPGQELGRPVELRKISLRKIEEALAKSGHNAVNQLPDDIRFLAGIQRLQYVFVYPEQNDIVLAGPGEGWKVDEQGNVVGVTTNRPVLRLDDLVVAFRSVENARNGGITCSIDPTAQGRQQFEAFMSRQSKFGPQVPAGIEKALGPQQITVTGVPDTSRLARILVASDYHMKRIAMKLDASPVPGLPSFIDMLKGAGQLNNMMPRWWMACDYQPIAKTEDGLAWEIRGPGVKVMTEDEIIAGGAVKGTGKVNPVAQAWAEKMTEKYDELAAKEASFGDLRNIMDMCVIAALIAKEDLVAKAKCELPTMSHSDSSVTFMKFDPPKTVATQCSVLKKGREYLITASGGVDINSWQIADTTEVDPAIGEVRTKAAKRTSTTSSIWWN
jgi:hypothetical protein